MAPPKVLSTWAQKRDEAAAQWARQVVDPWARTAEFSPSHLWAEAEAAVLAREYPPLPGTAVLRLLSVLTWVGLAVLLVLPTVGAAVIGLVLAVLSTAAEHSSTSHSLLVGARAAYVVANVVALTALGLWWELGKRRSWYGIATSAVTLCGSVCGYVWLSVHAGDVPHVPWLAPMILSACLFAVAGLVLALVSSPEGTRKNRRRKPPPRGPRSSDRRQRCLRARQRLLEIMQERRLVTLDDADRTRVTQMPLGYWCELDGLDEREWRRVLEHRHVGWREFDASERRS